jgi:hypothetical protein
MDMVLKDFMGTECWVFLVTLYFPRLPKNTPKGWKMWYADQTKPTCNYTLANASLRRPECSI